MALISLDGQVVPPDTLTFPRTRSFLTALQAVDIRFVTAVSAIRLRNGREAVVLNVEIELGQEPTIALQRIETIAVVFSESDASYPEVLSLRDDFPQVPHLNCTDEDYPKSLCLYEDSWAEVKLRWTPSSFVQRIRDWFALTAEGKLHGEDQPLEPILAGGGWRLVLPSDLFDSPPSSTPEPLIVSRTTEDEQNAVLIAHRPGPHSPPPRFLATTIQTDAQQHGVVRKRPRTLSDLATVVKSCGCDLPRELRSRLLAWDRKAVRHLHLLLVIYFPKTRDVGGRVESRDIWSFALEGSIETLGEKLGIWAVENGQIGQLLAPDLSKTGADVLVQVLNTSFALSRAQAALMNGVSPSTIAITAIGAGALGSQAIPKLIQSGFGQWVVIDDDQLLPHNVARHQFSSSLVGQYKAEILATLGNDYLEGEPAAKSIIANVLTPGKKTDDVEQALTNAEVILDFSASVAVGRHLSSFPKATGRRVSVFLNSSGTDLVVLAEDAGRKVRLDYLEMVYYAAVASTPSLSRHLSRGEQRVRYARSCRDLTSTVPEDLVGLHSSIASRAIRELLSSENAAVKIWRAEPDLTVSSISVDLPNRLEVAKKSWQIVTTSSLVEKMRALRSAKLPNETGGVFIGHFDSVSAIAYIVDTIPAPPDSKEYPAHYIRGSVGLKAEVQRIESATATMLHYVGEWHSHPNGFSTHPSDDDRKVFAWLSASMQLDGYPGLMAIVGENNEEWFVENME